WIGQVMCFKTIPAPVINVSMHTPHYKITFFIDSHTQVLSLRIFSPGLKQFGLPGYGIQHHNILRGGNIQFTVRMKSQIRQCIIFRSFQCPDWYFLKLTGTQVQDYYLFMITYKYFLSNSRMAKHPNHYPHPYRMEIFPENHKCKNASKSTPSRT